MREQLREQTKQYEKSENDLKALQSVGQVTRSPVLLYSYSNSGNGYDCNCHNDKRQSYNYITQVKNILFIITINTFSVCTFNMLNSGCYINNQRVYYAVFLYAIYVWRWIAWWGEWSKGKLLHKKEDENQRLFYSVWLTTHSLFSADCWRSAQTTDRGEM